MTPTAHQAAAIASPPDLQLVATNDVLRVLEVALANPVRTRPQQRALVRLCGRVTSFLCDWAAWADTSWTHVPCEGGCGGAVGRNDAATGVLCRECREAERGRPW